MLALDLLGVPFARTMYFGVEMAFVRPPMICIKTREPEGIQQRFELQKDFVFAATKDIRQDLACVVINGMPQPALVAFLADKAPHFVDLSFPSLLNVHQDLGWINGTQQRAIDRCQCCFFFPECTQHGVGADTQHPCGIAYPAGIEAHINDLLLHLRQPPLIAVLKQKALRGTCSSLAQITLCSAACRAAFHDLNAVTIRTAHGDESHGLLLVSRCCRGKAQCDINLSSSPHREHYRYSDTASANGHRGCADRHATLRHGTL